MDERASPDSQLPDSELPPIEAKLVPSDSGLPAYRPADKRITDDTWQGGDSGSAKGKFQKKSTVLLLLFLVTGALGIPLLWEKNLFSPNERIVWSAIVSLYTLALIAIVVAIGFWCYKQIAM